jgi:D-xylose transport system permease protein
MTETSLSKQAEPERSEELAGVPGDVMPGGIKVHAHAYLQRIRGGDMGSLPATVGLVVLVIFFWAVHPTFGSLGNLSDLLKQSSPIVFLAMGLVFVLLLGEIDLAAGTAAGVCACVMARMSVGYNWSWPLAILAAVVVGVVIGLGTGVACAKLRIPSFVVTLALFLAFQGVNLYIVNNGPGQRGNVTITDNFIGSIYNGQMKPWAGWLVVAILIAGYGLFKLRVHFRRSRAGLVAEPLVVIAAKVIALTAICIVAVYLLNLNRAVNKSGGVVNQNGKLVRVPGQVLEGVPWVVPCMLFFVVLWTLVLGRTRWGRHIYAVGGNPEAARRAGISTDRIRITAFIANSFMAALAGVLLASNLRSVDANTGGGNTLLLAVGAAVIGGTSLFGGKGRPMDAVIGGAVLAVIANGMATLIHGGNSSAYQYIVTGGVLLVAAAVDALSRRRAGASGLA